MKESYLTLIGQIERLHRQFLEVVGVELDALGFHDVNNVQALILFNLGDAELTVGELTLRGCYLGSNVSYNVKKMVESGYLIQERSLHDRRSMLVRLSPKGLDLCRHLQEMHDRHLGMLRDSHLGGDALREISRSLDSLDHFWTRLVERKGRPTPRPPVSATELA